MVRKLKSGQYRLIPDQSEDRQTSETWGVSEEGEADKHERAVQYFKRLIACRFGDSVMQSKFHEADGKRTFAVILQKRDKAMRCLQASRSKNVSAELRSPRLARKQC